MNEAEIVAGLARTPSYRYARRVGNQLFVAGQVPLAGNGELVVPDDAHAQATQCLKNLNLLLKVHSFSIADVQQITVYVAGNDDQLRQAWTAVTNWFAGSAPPATLLGVARLGYKGQLVELDATVIRP